MKSSKDPQNLASENISGLTRVEPYSWIYELKLTDDNINRILNGTEQCPFEEYNILEVRIAFNETSKIIALYYNVDKEGNLTPTRIR